MMMTRKSLSSYIQGCDGTASEPDLIRGDSQGVRRVESDGRDRLFGAHHYFTRHITIHSMDSKVQGASSA